MQPSLMDVQPAHDGPDLLPSDHLRLAKHLKRVVEFTADGRWHTLKAIAAAVGCTEASASARLRDLRRTKHGGFTVNRRRVTAGLWEYAVQL